MICRRRFFSLNSGRAISIEQKKGNWSANLVRS